MRWVLLILGILCALMGTVWILQGTYVLTQGFMAGQTRWTIIGAAVAAVGVALVVVGAARRKKRPKP